MPTKKKSKSSKYKIDTSPPKSSGWVITNNIEVKYSDAEYLGKYKGSNLYATISVDYDYDSRWNSALSKGFAKNAKSCGVKFFKTGYECKIAKADERLFTNKLYQNESGEYLIYFDKELNHKAVKRAINTTPKLLVEECVDLLSFDNIPIEGDMSTIDTVGEIDDISC